MPSWKTCSRLSSMPATCHTAHAPHTLTPPLPVPPTTTTLPPANPPTRQPIARRKAGGRAHWNADQEAGSAVVTLQCGHAMQCATHYLCGRRTEVL